MFESVGVGGGDRRIERYISYNLFERAFFKKMNRMNSYNFAHV